MLQYSAHPGRMGRLLDHVSGTYLDSAAHHGGRNIQRRPQWNRHRRQRISSGIALLPTAGGAEDDRDDAAAEALARAAQISFEEEFQDGDWRVRRAQLLAGDDARWVEQLARNNNVALKGTETWVHLLDEPEPGAVLLADPKSFHFRQQHFAQCVILLLEHDEQGSIGVILNRPTPFSLDDGEQIPPAFRNRGTVRYGGDVRGNAIVHTATDIPGAKELMPGLFYGGSLQAAGKQVESGNQAVEDFRFFVGICGWGPGQLSAELARGGSWHCAACSPELLLVPRRHYQPALWRELLTLMGQPCAYPLIFSWAFFLAALHLIWYALL